MSFSRRSLSPTLGPATRTRGATPAPSAKVIKGGGGISNAQEGLEFLQVHGYCTAGTSITISHLSLLLHQATRSLPRTASGRLAVDTFTALAYLSETLSVDLLADRVATAVVGHLEDSVQIIQQAAATAQDAANTVSVAQADGAARLTLALDAAAVAAADVKAATHTAKEAVSLALDCSAATQAGADPSAASSPLQPPSSYAAAAASVTKAVIARGNAHDCRFVVKLGAAADLGELTEQDLVEKANATLALLSESGFQGPVGMAFLSASSARNRTITYHLNDTAGARWLAQTAIRPRFVERFEGASSAISSLLQCVVEFVPVAFEPADPLAVSKLEEDNELGDKTIQYVKYFKKPVRRADGQRTAFLLMGFLTREAANLAIANGLLIYGRVCVVRKLLAEPLRCFNCQKWNPGHLAAACPILPASTCARCAGPHRTGTCSVSDADTLCANCPANEAGTHCHGAGDRSCPAFVALAAVVNARTPSSLYRFFPTNDPVTWERADAPPWADTPGGQDAQWVRPNGDLAGGWSSIRTARAGRGQGRLAGGTWGGGAGETEVLHPLPVKPRPAPALAPPPGPSRASKFGSKAKGKGKASASVALWRRPSPSAGPPRPRLINEYFSQSQGRANTTGAGDTSWATAVEAADGEDGAYGDEDLPLFGPRVDERPQRGAAVDADVEEDENEVRAMALSASVGGAESRGAAMAPRDE